MHPRHSSAGTMRVAMLTYSTRPRGGVVHALKLTERLRGLGVDVTLYSLARRDDMKAHEGYFRPIPAPFKIIPYDWRPDLIDRLESMISAYRGGLPRDMDVYHAQDCVGGTVLHRLKVDGIIKAPVFRTVHHVDDFAEPRLFEFEKKAVGYSDHAFVVSKYWKAILAQAYGVDSTVTYNGLDTSDFAMIPPRRLASPNVLFVGGLEPRKGLEYLVLAMERVVRAIPETRLVAIAKTGFRGTDEWSWFRTLAARLGLSANMEFLESVSQERILQAYADCDLLVLPSKTEGWGLSLMEAMACGKPVVASRVGGVPELVTDGSDGLLVDAGDVGGIADSILRLLRDAGLRERMGSAGRERVSHYSWDDTARTVLDAYESSLR